MSQGKDTGRHTIPFLAGGAAGTVLGAGLASLLAARPAAAAPPDEKLDYLIELQADTLMVVDALTQNLGKVSESMTKLVEIQGLSFALDPLRYIGRKMRSGEGFRDMGSTYIPIGAGATITLMMSNIEGYVWLGLYEGLRFSQTAVIEYTRLIDGTALPWIYVPRGFDMEINWSETMPFGIVCKETYGAIYTNHDAFAQWIMNAWYGAYIRKDVWEKDSRLMDMAAEEYVHGVEEPYDKP